MLPSLKKKGYLTDVTDERVAIGAFVGKFNFYPPRARVSSATLACSR